MFWRTRLALQARAKEGHSADGVSYGYCNEPIAAGKPGGRKRLVIEPIEAAIVVRIFTMYADGRRHYCRSKQMRK